MVIHLIGDSHASNQISGWKDCSNVISHYLGAVLCFSVGRDGLDRVNIQKLNIKESDTVIFCFGEIDCRCHIHKHIAPEKTYQDIIDNIIEAYFKTIQLNQELIGNNLKVCVYNVVPPVRKSEAIENCEFPFLGTDQERQNYVMYFNSKLKDKCQELGFVFFDVYDQYSDSEGFLEKSLSDGNVHIYSGKILQEFINKEQL